MSLTTAARRRSQQRDDVRRTIVAATQAILGEGGYAGFSIRRLSERCGYAAPTIYHHFKDKTGLLDAVVEERFQALLQVMRRVPDHEDPLDTIRARALAFVRFGVRYPTHYHLLTLGREAGATPLPAVEKARDFLERPWRELAETGRLAIRDIEIAQRTAFALLHGLISLHNSRPDLAWSPVIFEEAIDALLRGLVPSSTSHLAAPQEGSPR